MLFVINWLCLDGEIGGKYKTRKIKNQMILLLRNALLITNIRVIFSQSLSLITKKAVWEEQEGAITRQRIKCAAAKTKKARMREPFSERMPITGWIRSRSGILLRLPETRPYLLFLFPTVPGKLHRALRGTAARQPYAAFHRCYDPAADR